MDFKRNVYHRWFRFAAVATILLLTFSAVSAEKGGGKGKPGSGPADPVFVRSGLNSIEVFDLDGSNLTTVFVGSSTGNGSHPTWIPNTSSIIFKNTFTGTPRHYELISLDISVDPNGEVEAGTPEILHATPYFINSPSWHWGPDGGEVLFKSSVEADEWLEILDVDSGTSQIIYQAPPDYTLNHPIRSADGSLVWVLERAPDTTYETATIIEIDHATGTANPLMEIFDDGAGNLWSLAAARTFNGFAYNTDGNTYVWDGGSSAYVTDKSTPRTFSSDDSFLVVGKYTRKWSLNRVYWDTTGEEDTLIKATWWVDLMH